MCKSFVGIAGHFIKTDRWEEVPLERLPVSLALQRPRSE